MDKRLKILLEEVKGSDPNLDTMDRNTRVRAGKILYCSMNLTNGQVTLEKEIQLDDIDKVTHEEHILTLEIGDSAEVSERNLEKLRANAGEQFKNGLKNAILAYKDGPIA